MVRARPIVVDLFAGAGGLSLGFEQAGYDVAAAVEFDPVHAATHEFNFPNGTSICADVREVSGELIRTKSAIGQREVHAVVGGAPCQGFSTIGKRALDDPRNSLVLEFARIVLELQPRYFVLENVAGLAAGNHRRFLDEVMDVFEAGGYQVERAYRVLQAAEFGTPQHRRRLFLMGARSDVELPKYPTPTTTARRIKGVVPAPSEDRPLSPSVWDAISDLPEADHFDELLRDDMVEAKFDEPSAYAATLRAATNGLTDFSHPRIFDADLLTSSARTAHSDLSRSRFAATAPGQVEPVSRFLRLHPEGVSNTLRAGTARDRGAFTSPRPIHPVAPRCITVREAARLHGYPDWFRFHVTKWHGFRQIGNSVPPLLGRAVAEALLRADGVVPTQGAAIPVSESDWLLRLKLTEAARVFGVDPGVIPNRDKKVG